MKSKKKKNFSNDIEDLKLLGWASLVILAVWALLPSISFTQPLMHEDGVLLLPRIKEYLSLNDWTQFIYRADTLGGVAFVDVWGKPFIYDVLAYIGVGPQTALNIALIVTQVTLAYLGAKAAQGLSTFWGESLRFTHLNAIGLTLLFAFIPVLGSRTQNGHLEIIWGIELFLILLNIGLGLKNSDFTRVQWTVIFWTFLHCLPSLGHQTKLYSVVFGAFIFVPLFWGKLSEIKNWKTTLMLSLGTLLVALPRFYGMLVYAISSDPARGFGKKAAIYAYPSTDLYNWMASLTWNYKIFSRTTDNLLTSEFYFPMGPFVLFLALLFFKSRKVFIGTLLSALFAIGLSLQWEPFSFLLQTLIPPIKMFRIPEKSMMVFCLFLPIVAVALSQLKLPKQNSKESLPIAIALMLLIIFIPPSIREATLWVLAAGMLFLIFKNKTPKWLTPTVFFLVFGAGSVMSFHVWLKQAPSKVNSLNAFEKMGDQIKTAVPAYNSHLKRAVFNFEDPHFKPLTSVIMGISNLTGYWHPMSRFAKIGATLNGSEYETTNTYYKIVPGAKSWPVLSQLYNVCCEIKHDKKNNQAKINTIKPTLGEAWFSHQVQWTDDFNTLAKDLTKHLNSLNSKLFLVSSDPMAVDRKLFVGKDFSKCSAAQILEGPLMDENHQSFRIKVSSPSQCPLTLPMNYTEMFKAKAITENQTQELQVFPSYGPITSVLAPKGDSEIVIYAKAYTSTALGFFAFLGMILFLWGLFRSGGSGRN